MAFVGSDHPGEDVVMERELGLNGFSTGSPARDQQLQLERDVFRSLSSRRKEPQSFIGHRKVAIILGVSSAVWATVFGAMFLLS